MIFIIEINVSYLILSYLIIASNGAISHSTVPPYFCIDLRWNETACKMWGRIYSITHKSFVPPIVQEGGQITPAHHTYVNSVYME